MSYFVKDKYDMGFFSTLSQGQTYLKTWPLVPKLSIIFPENRIIKATQFAQKAMPFVAVFSIVWQQFYAKHDHFSLAIAVISAIVALCIPIQGLYWLGKRAVTKLPPQSAVKFFEISNQFNKENMTTSQITSPTYQDLANLLAKIDKSKNTAFWDTL